MSEQVWLFPAIHGAIATLRGHAAAIHSQTEELSGAVGTGISLWEARVVSSGPSNSSTSTPGPGSRRR